MNYILRVIKTKWGIVILAITAAGLLVLAFLFSLIWQRKPIPEEVISPVQEKINQQLEELDELRQQSGQQATTEEKIQQQLEELDVLRAKSAE